MNKLTPSQKINNLILILEAKQELQYEDLKLTIDQTIDQMQPSSFVTNFVKNLLFTEQTQAPLVASIINLASHFMSKNQSSTAPKSFLRKLANLSIQYISKNLFSTNKS